MDTVHEPEFRCEPGFETRAHSETPVRGQMEKYMNDKY